MGAGRAASWDTEVIDWEGQEKVGVQEGLAPTADPVKPYGLYWLRDASERVIGLPSTCSASSWTDTVLRTRRSRPGGSPTSPAIFLRGNALPS